jgi:hypothetical protein
MYFSAHPDNLVVFNGNVCTDDGKIWYGDLDITKDEDKLTELASKLGCRIYVLREHDGRFDNEDAPLLGQAVASYG